MNPLFSNFLNKRTSKSCNLTNRHMFNELFSLFNNWLLNKEDIILIKNDVEASFYSFLCKVNKIDLYDEYITLKYSDEIVDLFLEMKKITMSYGSLILHEKGRTSDDLLQVILNNTEILEDIYADEDVNEKDFNDYE
ncbi:MAG: hypothetical protein CMD68_02640 [Gammaproteobacteria bacterium]|nr:hypothetical protein [Gammaproteobacteria bacterium]